MSSYDFGSVKCEIEHKYRDLTIGIGRGWGGDGKYPHRAYFEWWDDNDELHMIHFTFPALDTLVKLLVPMYFHLNKEIILEQDYTPEEEKWYTDYPNREEDSNE